VTAVEPLVSDRTQNESRRRFGLWEETPATFEGTPDNQGVSRQEAPPKHNRAQTHLAPLFYTLCRSALIGSILLQTLRAIGSTEARALASNTVLAYVFLALALIEAFFDPLFRGRAIRGALLIIGLVAWFTVCVVLAKSSMNFVSYSMMRSDYAPGTVIGGIAWDSHFTDLRVAITNPSDDAYRSLNISIQPDTWTHKAAILSAPPGCELVSLGGNTTFVGRNSSETAAMVTTSVATGFAASTSLDNTFTLLATQGGYRLACVTLPPRQTVQIVFAAVAVHPDLVSHPQQLQSQSPGTWDIYADEIRGAQSEFTLLDARPSPSIVKMRGSYTTTMKKCSITAEVNVTAGI